MSNLHTWVKQDLFLEVRLTSGLVSTLKVPVVRSGNNLKSIFYPFPYSIYFSSHRVQEGYLSLAAVGGSDNLEIKELSSKMNNNSQ